MNEDGNGGVAKDESWNGKKTEGAGVGWLPIGKLQHESHLLCYTQHLCMLPSGPFSLICRLH